MPHSRKGLFAALITPVVFAAVACSTSDAQPSSSASSTAPTSSSVAVVSPSGPAGSVRLSGAVQRAETLSPNRLRAFPPRTQSVTFRSSEGAQSHTYVGASLFDIVRSAGLVADPGAKNADLTLAVRATGSDGYEAVVSFGEFSPDFGGTAVLVAYTEDGRALAGPRLVVPGDIKGGRYVTDVVSLEVVDNRGR